MQHDAEKDDAAGPGMLSGPSELLAGLWRLMRREAWLYALIVLALIAAEGALRWSQPRLAGLTYAADRTGGHAIALSPEGYRIAPDAASGNDAQDGTPVVIGLGDSTTFGTGVGARETWPLALTRQLGDRATVRNAGAEGSELREFAFGLRDVWNTPAPEAAVLLITANMISFTDFRRENDIRDPRDRIRRLKTPANGPKRVLQDAVQSSALWKTVTLNVNFTKFALGLIDHRVRPERPLSPLMAYGWVQADVAPEHYTRMWDRFETALRALADKAEADGTCLVLGFLPPRFTLGDHLLDNLKSIPKGRLTEDAGARVRALARTLDLPYAETEAALRATRAATGPVAAPLYIPGDYTHLDARGHGLMADAFARTLTPILEDRAPCRFGAGPL